MNCRAKVVGQESDLTPFLDDWRRWAPTPLQSPEWLLAWWSAFKTPASRLAVVVIYDHDEPIGLAPFYVRDHWTTGRNIQFLGSGRACSDFQTLLAAPGQEVAVAEELANWLIDASGDMNWSFLELEGTVAGDSAVSILTSRLKRHRCLIQTIELNHTWRLDLTGGWDGFLAGLSRTQRSQTRTLINRFEKNKGLTLRYVSDTRSLTEALEHSFSLHQRRWTSIGEPGCFADIRFRTFISRAYHALANRGRMQIALLEDQETPIASQLCLCDAKGNQFMYQSGRDPDRESENIGRMLNALVVRTACERGTQFIDFLRGDEIYKQRLGAAPRKCLRTRIVAPATLPRLRHGVWSLGRRLKHSAKAIVASPSRSLNLQR